MKATIMLCLLLIPAAAASEAWTFYSEPQVWQEWCCQEVGSDYGCWSADRYWSWESCGDPNGGFLVIDARSTFDSAGCAPDGLAMRQQIVTVNPWVVPATGYYQVRVRYGYAADLGACTADPSTAGVYGGLTIGGYDISLSGGMPDAEGNGALFWLLSSVRLDQGASIYPAIYADLGPDAGSQTIHVTSLSIDWDEAIATRETSWSTVKAFY